MCLCVQPPGALQENHTSLLLDLTNRAYFFTFLDVAIPSGHVPGSAQAYVSVFGGSVGPVQPSVQPTPTSLLNLPLVSYNREYSAIYSLYFKRVEALYP